MELKANSKVYLDTNIFIYYFEDHPRFAKKIEELFDIGFDKNMTFVSSELLYLETLVLPYKKVDRAMSNLYLNIEKHIPNFYLAPINKSVLLQAAKIRAKYGFKSPDSIHLATAVTENCDLFFGFDKQLMKYEKINVRFF